VSWPPAALGSGRRADAGAGGWVDAVAAKALPAAQLAALQFVRVDTSQLGAAIGQVDATFMRVLSDQVNAVSAVAVAGRKWLQVTPLGICALNPAKTAPRNVGGLTELVEYGFRRGVGYNLLSLSPLGTLPLNFLVDPVEPAAANAAPVTAAAAAPFVCSGTMPLAALPATVHVTYPFPSALSSQLNSRFDVYGGTSPCHPLTAPPDLNIKPYPTALPTPPAWWSVTPAAQTAQNTAAPLALVTVADVAGAAPDAASYGVLWSYAIAAQWAAAEPSGGYAAFPKSSWSTLYPVPLGKTLTTQNATGSGATKTPYNAGLGGSYFSAPSNPGIALRRVLNVLLLACPSATGANTTASVLGIGRFFMTVQATDTAISAEFAGLVPQAALGGPAELFQ
jgi:hypothetical protein